MLITVISSIVGDSYFVLVIRFIVYSFLTIAAGDERYRHNVGNDNAGDGRTVIACSKA